MKKRLKIILGITGIIILGIVFLFCTGLNNNIKDSFNSATNSCDISLSNFTDEQLYYAGVLGYYNKQEQSITVLVSKNDSRYDSVIKHEMCHYNQEVENRRVTDCENKIGIFINEMECYIKQR